MCRYAHIHFWNYKHTEKMITGRKQLLALYNEEKSLATRDNEFLELDHFISRCANTVV